MAEFGTAIRKGGPATQPSDSTSSSVSNPDYNPKQWWRYSDGVREVIGESIAYIYAKFLFYPSVSLSDKEPAQGLRHLVDLLGTWMSSS
jgi:hypothetical protein